MSLLNCPTNFGRMVIHLRNDLKLTLSGSWTQNSATAFPKGAHYPNHLLWDCKSYRIGSLLVGCFFLFFFCEVGAYKSGCKNLKICVTVASSCDRFWSGYGLVETHRRNDIKHETGNEIQMVCQSLNSKKKISIAVQLQKCLEIDVKSCHRVFLSIVHCHVIMDMVWWKVICQDSIWRCTRWGGGGAALAYLF